MGRSYPLSCVITIWDIVACVHSESTGWPWRQDRLWRATTLERQLPLCVRVPPTVSSRSLLWRTFSLDWACIWSRVEWPLQMEPSLKVGEQNITVYVLCPFGCILWPYLVISQKRRGESSYLARVSINMCCLCVFSSDCQYSLYSDQVTLSSKLPSTPSRTCLRTLVGSVYLSPSF